jgi:vacuolar-type H+-ATPase subunit E/Vma4
MRKLIEQKEMILSDFDFKKVQRVMKALKWQWVGKDGVKYTPNEDDLSIVAGFCLSQVIKSKGSEDMCCIGGFEALRINGVLELRFVIEKNNTLSQLF